METLMETFFVTVEVSKASVELFLDQKKAN